MEREILTDLGILGAFIVGAIIVHFALFRVLRGIFVRAEGFEPNLLKKAKPPALGLLIILAITFALPVTDLEQYIHESVRHILSLLIIFFLAWLLIKIISIIRGIVLLSFDIQEQDNLKARKAYTQLRILERITIFLIVLIAVGVSLMTFDTIRQIGVSLLASAGLAGIILGFAAQKAIATVLAGFQIAMTQPIRIDDVVIVDGEWGRVEEIHLTYVVVKIWDERRLVVPTTYFIDHSFQNWTRVSADILGTIFIYTDYSVDFEALRKFFLESIEKEEKWDGRVKVMQVTDSTEKSVQIRFLVSASDSGSAWDLRVSLREKIISYLQKNHPGALPQFRLNELKKI
ncbi:MAG: mechanosensitive ion channel family protein [Candidatus Cyclobacteriaceae bacterium M2_1C_046]